MLSIDEKTYKGCLKQDKRAEHALYKACFQSLMSVCFRYTNNEDDAAALMNLAFFKILKNLSQYHTDKPFDKWAKSITINVIIDEFRSQKKDKEMINHVDMDNLLSQHHPVDYNAAEIHLTADDIHRCLNKVPEASRMVLNLYVFEGLSHKEIAETFGITEGTSKWHLSNARNILKKLLSQSMKPVKTVTA